MSDVVSLLRRLVLESPPGEWALRRLRELLIGALRQGPVPQHVAFEMDGNRRYAKSHRMETVEGHHRGFEALARVRRQYIYIYIYVHVLFYICFTIPKRVAWMHCRLVFC